jgi:hypothetical protein
MHAWLRSIGLETRFRALKGGYQTMNRNILYVIIGVLAIVTVVIGYQLYQERQKTTGIEINIGERGISIEKK